MEYTFKYESEYLALKKGIEDYPLIEVTIDAKLRSSSIYDSPQGPLGQGILFEDHHVESVFCEDHQDLGELYKTDLKFFAEVEVAIADRAERICEQWDGESEAC